jgi:hypothetical protein
MRTLRFLFVVSVVAFPSVVRADDTWNLDHVYRPSVELGRIRKVELEVLGNGGAHCLSDLTPLDRIVKGTLRDLKIEPSPPLRPNEDLAKAYPDFKDAPKLTVETLARDWNSHCEWIFRVELKARLEGGTILGAPYSQGGTIRGEEYSAARGAPIILWNYEHPGYTEFGDFTSELVPLVTEAMRELRETIEISRTIPQ